MGDHIQQPCFFPGVLGLDYPIPAWNCPPGVLNMVPYIGAVMAWLPAFMLALTKWQTIGWFFLIAGVLTGIHIFAPEFDRRPQLVGRPPAALKTPSRITVIIASSGDGCGRQWACLLAISNYFATLASGLRSHRKLASQSAAWLSA